LEELDDEIKAAGGTATLVPLDLRDHEGLARLATALTDRYRKLDILIGNAGIGGPSSPLDHVQLKDWDEVFAVNVTANFQLIRLMNPLLQKSDAARVIFLTSGAAVHARAYRGPYSASKAALEALARTYANENVSTNVRVNLHSPGPTRTRLRAAVMPGEDPMMLPTPEDIAETIVPLCLPSFNETGKLYDYQMRKLMSFRSPA
jgi:NAD(P)-dependent dehydrogenase (short-subunit alcohol dehydrogenase family)